jgi:menaquinone-dependent protoporphyrinogen oxidase
MRILVTAASKHGATAEIAEAIGRTLREDVTGVDVVEPGEVTTVDGYDAVVLGSAVYAGRWLEPARRFVSRWAFDLRRRPVWLFSSGPIGDLPEPDEAPVDVGELMTSTGAREHRIFGGRLERRRLGMMERAMVQAIRAPDGDFRDWSAIADWARGISAALTGRPVRETTT